MRNIKISAEHPYEVFMGASWQTEIERIFSQYGKVLILSPEDLVNSLDLHSLSNSKVSVLGLLNGEDQKSISSVESIWEKAAQVGLTRKDAIVGIGGGATTDVAGFAAATWLRGIDWFAFPTSIAGMVDAAIGGKTGINTASGKNLVGSFHSPQGVFIDFGFLKTLPLRDYNAGMAEIIKCGLIQDTKILELVSEHEANIEELIARAVSVKANVVSADFKEGRLREILNYGHTLGHAIEKMEKYKWRHGEAIAIGLVFAAELSRKFGLSEAEIQLHRNLLKSFDLPTSYTKGAIDELIEIMKGDKKTRSDQIRFIGLAKAGEPIWLEEITSDDIKTAYERICS